MLLSRLHLDSVEASWLFGIIGGGLHPGILAERRRVRRSNCIGLTKRLKTVKERNEMYITQLIIVNPVIKILLITAVVIVMVTLINTVCKLAKYGRVEDMKKAIGMLLFICAILIIAGLYQSPEVPQTTHEPVVEEVVKVGQGVGAAYRECPTTLLKTE